jgi:hypothetical protein
MRRSLLALVCFAIGCVGPQFAVIPRDGAPRVTATAPTGLTMTAFANQWENDPYDLADFVTPIAVELYNPGPNDIRVSYVDFTLKDGRGTRFGAVNPFVPASLGQNIDPIEPMKPKLVLLAGRTGGSRGGMVGAPRGGGGGFSSGRMGGMRGGFLSAPSSGGRLNWGGYGWGRGAGWRGFYISNGLRPYYGAGGLYWSGLFPYPPGYSDWVFWWGPSFYPTGRPSADVMAMALPEGVLSPGARVDGFLYFKKATAHETSELNLGWELVDPRTSQSFGSTHVMLQVVER